MEKKIVFSDSKGHGRVRLNTGCLLTAMHVYSQGIFWGMDKPESMLLERLGSEA
jgi:hypothetical protein